MGAFTWVLVCAVIFLFDAGIQVDSERVDSTNDIGPTDRRNQFQDYLVEGRHSKKKKKIMNMVIAAKIVIFSFLIPKIIALTLYASWKGITISLIALAVACVAVKQSHSGRGEHSDPHFLLKKYDDNGHNGHYHEHWWRKVREADPIYEDVDVKGPYHSHHKLNDRNW